MKKCLLATASVAAAAIACSGMARAGDVAQSHTYIQLFGGYAISSGQSSYYDDVYDQVLHDGFVVGAALGTYVGDGLRLEQELSYVRNENDATDYDESDVDDYHNDYTGHTSSIYILTNLWKEVGLGPLRPYAGAGLGVGFIKNDGDYDDGENGWNDTGFGLAAQLGAGLRFGLGDSLALDAGYRLKGIVDATFTDIGVDENGGSGNSVYSHTFQLGAAYAINGSAMPDLGEGGNWYVSLFGGAAMPSSGVWSTAEVYTFEGKTGFSVGMAVGTELADGLRGEVELSYLNYAIDAYSSETGSSEKASGNLKAGFLLANVWNDIDLGFMTPYVGGGLGFALAHMSDGDFDGDLLSDSKGLSFAGQFGVGARFGVTDHLQLDVGYRFKSIIEAMIQTDDESDYDNAELASHQHVLQAGLTYNIAGTPTVEPMADVADSPDGLYASLFGGAVFPAHTHIASSSSNYIAEFKTGFMVGAAVGASLTDSLRGEVELSYLSSDVKQVTEEDTKAESTGNSLAGTFLLANLWYDMSWGGFTPYLGGGMGMALMDGDIILYNEGSSQIDDQSLALAAQIGAGVRFAVTDTLTIDAGYRFKSALGVATDGAEDGAEAGYASYYANVGQVGVSWTF